MEVELNRAEQTALIEAEAASAAINEETDYVPSGEEDQDPSEVDSLLGDFDADESATEATDKTEARKALK